VTDAFRYLTKTRLKFKIPAVMIRAGPRYLASFYKNAFHNSDKSLWRRQNVIKLMQMHVLSAALGNSHTDINSLSAVCNLDFIVSCLESFKHSNGALVNAVRTEVGAERAY
jgi:hypothetical protein